MSKYLVILESPEKARKVSTFLGKDYDVTASVGHIADLPAKGLSVDIKKDFKPTYEVNPDKKQVVKTIIDKAKKAEIVYLMTDMDREGEAISWHISNQLPAGTKYKRAITNSITKDAVLKALANAGDIDMDTVYAYEARRIMDRLCGYKTSYITKMATGGPSAGRVQSAALRILAEREREIRSFISEVYWPIQAEVLTEDKEKIIADIKTPKSLDIKTEEQASKICFILKKGPVKVSKFEKKEISQNAYAPFITSDLIQSASSIFGWKEDRTMRVAQSLHNQGHITYHRTDSKFIIADVIKDIRNVVDADYGKTYLPAKANVYLNKKSAQEAHEAIRPTHIETKFVSTGDDTKLYQMIWKRTVASQMKPLERLSISAEFSCDTNILGATGYKTLFDGWRKCWDYSILKEEELPDMKVGDKVDIISIKTEKKETQPPSRYSGASFNKKLETVGIGRPATYASIPKTLEDRGYITREKSINVTDLGLKVDKFLQDVGFCFIDLDFTAKMEDQLDEISEKKINKLQVLTAFWDRLKKDIDKAKDHKQEASVTDVECPECKKQNIESFLVKKFSKFGEFCACPRYKEGCLYKINLGKDGKPIIKEQKEIKLSDIDCPKCGKKLVIRQGRKGEFLGCPGFFKGCKGIYNLDGTEIVFSKSKKWGKKKSTKNNEEN